MIIPWDNLINLSVETESGNALGAVSGVDIETEAHAIKSYRVKSKGIIKGLLNDELLISSTQVISIDKDKMVVDDNAVREKILNAKKIVQVARGTSPEVTSTLESGQN
jgi:uncharacterized protein YrrD